MSVNIYNKENDKLNLVAGGTLYADAPIGSIVPYGGVSAPYGWLVCQGQAVSRTEYADLFNVIGTAYGKGDESTTFNVPKYTQLKQNYTVKTQLDTWRNSLEDGSESHTFTIDKDGSYYFEVVLSNSTGGKQSNNITLTGNNDLVCSWGYVGSNALLQNKTIFLKAGTYVVTHLCQTAGIGGTAVVTVSSTRNEPVGSYIIKAKQVAVPFDMAEYIRNQNVLSSPEAVTLSNKQHTMEYDGIFTFSIYAYNASQRVKVSINNVLVINASLINYPAGQAYNSYTVHANKGDTITIDTTINLFDTITAQYYKLRDYTGR